jgi:hypothetical protein
LYAVDCARMVQHLMTDQRSLDALNIAERHADGLASDEDLAASWDAARSAARSVRSAWTASWAAARSAARAAADAAWAASWAAEDTARADQANLLALMCAEIEQREEV